MQQLSAHIAGALKTPLPAEVVERAKVHLVDTFAAAISGTRLFPGKRAIAYVKPLGGKREAGVIGTRIVTTALNAALANGMCGHADETDDTHPASRTHPGTCVIPAALAIAERQQLSGHALLRATVLGYDLCARTVISFLPKFVNSSFGHLFGAAAAAAALLKLDEQKIRYVLGYAGQQASGLQTRLRDSHHVEGAYAVGGMPAHHGVQAALLVKSGFTAVDDLYSGDSNFFATFSPDADRDALVRGLGRDYEIMRGGIKCWSVGGPIQGPLHVLREIIQQHGLQADRVEKVVARMPDKELAIVNNRDNPLISVQHLLAVMLLDGAVTFASSHNSARMHDPKVLALRRRIETVGDASLTDAQRRWRCVMEVTLKDGRKLTHQTMAAKGTYENPVTRQEEQVKALDLIAPVLGTRRTRQLLAALWDIERVKDVRALRKFYMK